MNIYWDTSPIIFDGNSIIWINQSTLKRRDGAFSEFEEWSETILTEEAVRLSKLDKKIAEETRWSRQGISARRKRNQGRLRELAALRVVRKSDFNKAENEFKIFIKNEKNRVIYQTTGYINE